MQQITQAPAETQAPATLDGVVIDSCVFTESVGKREPRPPLFHGKYNRCGHVNSNVVLAIDGGRVLLNNSGPCCEVCGRPNEPMFAGDYFPGPPKGPRYTGPITPAMWAIIRKYWKP